MAVLDKAQALEQLERHRRLLLGDGEACVMCALARGRGDPAPLAESAHVVVVLDRFACRPGHLMVIAKRHVEHGIELGWDTYAEVQRSVFHASRALERALSPARLFTASLGAAMPLPMSFAHYHVHVIPVPETDERARPAHVLSWSSGVVVYTDSEAQQMRDRIVECWPSND